MTKADWLTLVAISVPVLPALLREARHWRRARQEHIDRKRNSHTPMLANGRTCRGFFISRHKRGSKEGALQKRLSSVPKKDLAE
jgi:hypothetical protein